MDMQNHTSVSPCIYFLYVFRSGLYRISEIRRRMKRLHSETPLFIRGLDSQSTAAGTFPCGFFVYPFSCDRLTAAGTGEIPVIPPG
ncbi:hypothetical protein [Paenibacillus sp. Z6-24]